MAPLYTKRGRPSIDPEVVVPMMLMNLKRLAGYCSRCKTAAVVGVPGGQTPS